MTTPRAPRALPTALLAGLLVIVSACSTGPSGDDDPTPDGASGTATDAADPGSTASEEEEAWRSPLGEFLQQSREQVQVDEAQIEHDNRAFAEAVQECMTEQGFDFHHDAPDPSGSRDGGPFSLPEDEFAAEYGYGITTIDEDGRLGWEDPNAAMLEEMSAAERTAWHRARYGDSMQIDENGDLVGMPAPVSKSDDVDRGCEGQAADEVWGKDDEIDHGDLQQRFASLFSDMATIWERVDEDPRVMAAVDDWSDCMADAGHPGMTETLDAYAAVRERMLEVAGTEDLASTADASGRDVAREAAVDALATTDPAEVQALREFEVALAVADLECQRSVRLDEVRQQVQTDIEIAFIEEHRDELEAYRAAVGDAEAQG